MMEPSGRRESRRPPSQGHYRAREDRSGRDFCTDGFRRNAGSGNRFGASNQSTRGIIRYCVEQQNEPKGGWFGARPKDRTGRSKWKQTLTIASKIRRLRRVSKLCATQRSPNFL